MSDALRDWSPQARQHRERVSGKLPLIPMDRVRDPWMRPAIIASVVIVAYFAIQFCRGWL
jgi:hypothetical protein